VATAEVGGQERAAFIESIEALLRPLMPLLLNYGVTYSDVQDVLRTLYVESMGARIRAQGRPSTPARLALMAGLNVGEVEKLTKSHEERSAIKARNVNRIDQVSTLLTVWHDDARFSTPYGAPLDLSLAPEKGFRTAADLFEIACPDVDRDLLLDELVASGSVEVHNNKFIRCVSRTFVPTGADVTRISRIGRYGGALTANFAHNLLRDPEEPSFFERTVVTESLVNSDFRDETLNYLRVHGQAFIENSDRWLTEHEPDFQDPNGRRYGFTLFFYEEAASTSEKAALQG
jgi:hypothetical protein